LTHPPAIHESQIAPYHSRLNMQGTGTWQDIM